MYFNKYYLKYISLIFLKWIFIISSNGTEIDGFSVTFISIELYADISICSSKANITSVYIYLI